MTRIITARFPGTAIDGTRVRKGAQILWDDRARKVLTSDPALIAKHQAGEQVAPAQAEPFVDIDTMWEDECARRCGL